MQLLLRLFAPLEFNLKNIDSQTRWTSWCFCVRLLLKAFRARLLLKESTREPRRLGSVRQAVDCAVSVCYLRRRGVGLSFKLLKRKTLQKIQNKRGGPMAQREDSQTPFFNSIRIWTSTGPPATGRAMTLLPRSGWRI